MRVRQGLAPSPWCPRRQPPARLAEATMLDLAMLILGFAFFASAIGYVLLCERL